MTTGAEVLTAVGVVLLLLLAWTAWTLTRLRRLASRVDRAWTALDTQLHRRAALAETLVRYHPAALGGERAAGLGRASAEARAPAVGDRELAENVLGRELRHLPAELPGVPPALLADLLGTATRVGLARRFYNDAVRDTRALRRRRLPRLLRLQSRRSLPRFFDIDDGLEEVITRTDGAGRSLTSAAVPWTGGTTAPSRTPAPRSRGSTP